MRVRYTFRARTDLEDIFGYLDERSAVGARSVKQAIERSTARLADFLFMAPETNERGVRELSFVRYPYKVYYQGGR